MGKPLYEITLQITEKVPAQFLGGGGGIETVALLTLSDEDIIKVLEATQTHLNVIYEREQNRRIEFKAVMEKKVIEDDRTS